MVSITGHVLSSYDISCESHSFYKERTLVTFVNNLKGYEKYLFCLQLNCEAIVGRPLTCTKYVLCRFLQEVRKHAKWRLHF